MGKLNGKRVALYARVSTFDQKTLSLQISQIRKYLKSREWQLVLEVEDVSSGAKERPKRDKILEAARRREIDFIIVWKLDRWGRSVVDLLTTLKELDFLGVGFISLTEALDLSTPTGRAMTGLLAVFAEFERELMQERIKAGIAHSRKNGKPHGRPKTAALKTSQIQKLKLKGLSHSAIARKLKTSRTSVRRLCAPQVIFQSKTPPRGLPHPPEDKRASEMKSLRPKIKPISSLRRLSPSQTQQEGPNP